MGDVDVEHRQRVKAFAPGYSTTSTATRRTAKRLRMERSWRDQIESHYMWLDSSHCIPIEWMALQQPNNSLALV